jgi:hypothetical protein
VKLSQKKNCNNCKGGHYESQPFIQRCDLGFKVTEEGFTGIPLEPCYKPLTYSKYFEAKGLVGK